jgi:hypothetical protein
VGLGPSPSLLWADEQDTEPESEGSEDAGSAAPAAVLFAAVPPPPPPPFPRERACARPGTPPARAAPASPPLPPLPAAPPPSPAEGAPAAAARPQPLLEAPEELRALLLLSPPLAAGGESGAGAGAPRSAGGFSL